MNQVFETTEGILLFSAISLFVGCLILYAVIKLAVTDGIVAAKKKMNDNNSTAEQ